MKIVINASGSGIVLPKMVEARLAEARGFPNRYCYGITANHSAVFTKVGKEDMSQRDAVLYFSKTDFGPSVAEGSKASDRLFAENIELQNSLARDNASYEFRTNPDLVAAVEKAGNDTDLLCCRLKVVEIPDGSDFFIDDDDYGESVIYSASEIKRIS